MRRTMTVAILTLTMLALPALVRAQVQTIDLSSLGLGYLQQPIAVEVDGNPATTEWLVTRLFTSERRIVKIAASGQWCVGPAFAVDLEWTVQRVGAVHMLTRLVWPHFELLSMAPYVPSC